MSHMRTALPKAKLQQQREASESAKDADDNGPVHVDDPHAPAAEKDMQAPPLVGVGEIR